MAYLSRYDAEQVVTWFVTGVVVLLVFVVWRKCRLRHYKKQNEEKNDLHTRETQTVQYTTLSSETQTDKIDRLSRKTQTDKSNRLSRETQTDKSNRLSRETQTDKSNRLSRETQTDKSNRLSRETQTDKSNRLSMETQTAKSKWFTDNLTEFETRDLGSDEFFDLVCEICVTGKEAVGFCEWCGQYMCLKCCKHHEKIRFSEHHVLKGKEDVLCSRKQVSMFGRKLVPVSVERVGNGYILTTILNDIKTESFVLILRTQNRCLYHMSMSDTSKTYHRMSAGKYCTHNYQDPEISFCIIKKRSVVRICSEHKTAVKCFATLANSTGITKLNHGLAVAQFLSTSYSVPSWSIQFLDFEGNVNNYVVYDTEGRPMFKNIYSLTADNTGNFLYVCDQNSCTLTVLSTNGKLVKKIAFSLDVYPREMVFDSEGNIYLACAYQVIQIDPLCKKFRVLFELQADKTNQQGNVITHVCFNKSANKMIILENAVTVTNFAFLPEYCRKSSIQMFPV